MNLKVSTKRNLIVRLHYSSSNLELEGVLNAFDIFASVMTVNQATTGIFCQTDEI